MGAIFAPQDMGPPPGSLEPETPEDENDKDDRCQEPAAIASGAA